MIDAPRPTRAEVAAQLWRWLPGVYRARDKGQLQAFLGLFADELWRLRALLEQQYADHYIDSAQEWVIPYLADLVGTDLLFTGDAARLGTMAARNRDDVKNTLARRRRKGTLQGLEGAAADVGGFGVHVVEMFERVAWLQNLVHLKPQARFAIDLRAGTAVAALATPFSEGRALVDLRPADARVGRHRATNVLAFEWPIASFPLAGVTPSALGGGRFTFDPLGRDVALYAGGATESLRAALRARAGAAGADILRPHADDVPIRTRDLAAHLAAYVDSPLGFALREDGIALAGFGAAATPAADPALGFGDLADTSGIVATDTAALPAAIRFQLDAVRLGAVFTPIDGVPTPVPYSPGQPLAAQLQLREAQGRLALDTVTPDFTYTAGVAPFEPDRGAFHHPALLMRIANLGAAAAALPACEAIVRSSHGLALQVFLPAVASLAAGAELHVYVASDGSTYYARGDHAAGAPDRNPDASVFGAFAAQHLARAAEGQRRIRPGHPLGAARWRRVVARPLCCWDRPLVPPLAPGEIAVDPERGRLMFPAAELPAGVLSVDFRYALTGEVGAGPYARAALPVALRTVAQTRDADFSSIQAAIDALPDGAAGPVVVEIADSAVYAGALQIVNRNFPGGLVIQAAALQSPFVVMPAAAAQALRVQTTAMASLVLDGIVFAGGTLEVAGTVARVALRHCTLDPASASLHVVQAGACSVVLDACISGPVAIDAPSGDCTASDSALQHPAATVEQPGGQAALAFANGRVALERCTIIGDVTAQHASVSNSLAYGGLAIADAAACCMRYSRLPRNWSAPAFRCTSATPIFVSLRCGDAGYLYLAPNSAPALLRGAEEGGEIGVFHRAGLPWRVQNAGIRLAEQMPAGLVPVQVPVLPHPRFRGNPRV